MLFGEFKREKLTYASGQLQLILSNDPDPLIDSYLKALEVENSDDFKKWSLSSLVLSHLGANYCGHEEIEEFFIQQISLKEINSKKEIQETIEQLSLLDNYDESDAIKRVKVQLLNICVKYDLFSNSDPIINIFYKIYAQKIESLEFIHEENGDFQKIDQKKFIEILQKFPNLKELTIQGYNCDLQELRRFTRIDKFTLNAISLTQEQLIDIIDEYKSTSTSGLIDKHLVCKFRDIPFDALSHSLQENLYFITLAFRKGDPALSGSLLSMCGNKTGMLQIVNECGLVLQYATPELQNDFDVGLAAVRNNSFALEFVSSRLKNNLEIVRAACEHDPNFIRYAGLEVRDNKEFMLPLVKEFGGNIFKLASARLQNDLEIVCAACKHDPDLIQYTGLEARDNKEFMLPLVKEFGGSIFKLASDRLRNDLEIARAACKHDPDLIQYTGLEARDNKEFMLPLVKEFGGSIFKLASDRLRNDLEIARAACEHDPDLIWDAGKEVRDNKEFVLLLVNRSPLIIDIVSPRLRNDLEIVLAACECDSSLIEFAGQEVRDNRESMLLLVKKFGGNIFKWASDRLRNDLEIVLAACEHDPGLIQYAGKEVQNNKEFRLSLNMKK